MKKNIKKITIISITLIISIFFILNVFSTIHRSIQKSVILKIGVVENKYDEPAFRPELLHCSLFNKVAESFKEDLAVISSSTNLITGIKESKFADGSTVTLQEVKASLPEDFFNQKTDLFHTPLTEENISKYFTSPVTSKDGLSCGAYNILSRNQNETILEKNKYYTGNFKSKYEKIVIRKVDLNARNESDILSDLVERRVDILINVFSPQKAFDIANQYPQLKIHTYSSSQRALLLIKKDSLTPEKISLILNSINIADISKFIYNSTLIPLLDSSKISEHITTSDLVKVKNKNQYKDKDKDTNEVHQKRNLYFLTTSSSSLLQASKYILSKLDTSTLSPILQVIDEEDLKDFASLSKNVNLILTDTGYFFREDFFEENDWIILPLWEYQDIVLSNNKIKDPSVFIK